MNRKKWPLAAAALAAATALAGAAAAAEPVTLVVNGREIDTDPPVQIVQDRALVPVAALAEALGASATWDPETHTVSVTDRSKENLVRQLELLTGALRSQPPEQVAETWALGVQTRNGALQYSVLSPGLRDKVRPDFEQNHWVTGTSSPWVQQYRIVKAERQSDTRYQFTIQFDLASSTGPSGSYTSTVTIERDPFPAPVAPSPGSPGAWEITKIVSPGTELEDAYTATIPQWNVALTLPLNVQLRSSDSSFVLVSGGGSPFGGIDKLGGPFVPNHAEVLEEKALNSPLGHGKLLLVKRSQPAAAPSPETWLEAHALLPLASGEWLDLWFKQSSGQDADSLKILAEKIGETAHASE
ncbi:MAG: copper amine oxidase N-terminal domain-containing protein [Alicyclobacillaceae bacterium]|nr:copper amine oxidase N-terminal domain-containing protein [Alicyclobacillaceae bacterium]